MRCCFWKLFYVFMALALRCCCRVLPLHLHRKGFFLACETSVMQYLSAEFYRPSVCLWRDTVFLLSIHMHMNKQYLTDLFSGC